MSIVEKNKYGFYSLISKPSIHELEEYYEKKYYQEDKSAYAKTYSQEELSYIENKIVQKFFLLKKHNSQISSVLDIGCGEGFAIKFLQDKGLRVLGLDFSDFGIKAHNPEVVNMIIKGDIYCNIDKLKNESRKFDVIWIDNVLEHLLDPLELLVNCTMLSTEHGLMIIEVPNDFSVVQNALKEYHLIDRDYWIAYPDHISYFNKDGLINICTEAGWQHLVTIGDFPIEFNLFNPEANYIKEKAKGKGAHFQRIRLENLFHEISIEKTNVLYTVLADMGLGRQIIGIYRKNTYEKN